MPEESISNKVDISLVLGYIAVKDLPTNEKKVAILAQLGYSNADMARICNSTPTIIKTVKSKVLKGG